MLSLSGSAGKMWQVSWLNLSLFSLLAKFWQGTRKQNNYQIMLAASLPYHMCRQGATQAQTQTGSFVLFQLTGTHTHTLTCKPESTYMHLDSHKARATNDVCKCQPHQTMFFSFITFMYFPRAFLHIYQSLSVCACESASVCSQFCEVSILQWGNCKNKLWT